MQKRKKIAIVSFEYEGLTENGGVGTAYRRLAELLHKNGHSITLVFLPFLNLPAGQLEKKFERSLFEIRKSGIKVVIPDFFSLEGQFYSDPYFNARTHAVYLYLSRNHFDVVHCPDTAGLVLRCLSAKNAELDFAATQFIVGAHGSSLWVSRANGSFHADALRNSDFERACLEQADIVVSPSEYMRNFLQSIKWKSRNEIRIIPHANCLTEISTKRRKSDLTQSKNKIIFFGRLEHRKGLNLFIEATILLLNDQKFRIGEKRLKISLLGRVPSSSWKKEFFGQIRERFRDHSDKITLSFVNNCNSEKALQFLKKRKRALICMPSLLENSPCAVLECLENELNFISSAAGGQAELIDKVDHKRALFTPKAALLAKKIRFQMDTQVKPPRPSRFIRGANHAWLALHQQENKSQPSKKKALPKVSIFLGHFSTSRASSILDGYFSIAKQTHKNIEIWLPAGIEVPSNIDSTFLVKRYFVGDTYKNLSKASGKYCLFLDGVQFSDRNSLENLVRSAENFSKKDDQILGFTADIKLKSKSRTLIATTLPCSRESFQCGVTVARGYTLWNSKGILKLAKGSAFLPVSPSSLAPFCDFAFCRGWRFVSVGLVAFTDSMDIRQRNYSSYMFLFNHFFSHYFEST